MSCLLYFTSLHFTSLHFTSLHLTSPHLTSLHFTSPHLTSLHFTSLHFTSLHFTSLHFTLLHFTSLYFTLLYFTLIVQFFFCVPFFAQGRRGTAQKINIRVGYTGGHREVKVESGGNTEKLAEPGFLAIQSHGIS